MVQKNNGMFISFITERKRWLHEKKIMIKMARDLDPPKYHNLQS